MFNEIFATAITVATTIALFVLVGPIMRTALRTGRWLGQGVVYDNVTTPFRFRLTLGGFILLMAVFTLLSALLSYRLFVILAG
jgi:hypothetical protein